MNKIHKTTSDEFWNCMEKEKTVNSALKAESAAKDLTIASLTADVACLTADVAALRMRLSEAQAKKPAVSVGPLPTVVPLVELLEELPSWRLSPPVRIAAAVTG